MPLTATELPALDLTPVWLSIKLAGFTTVLLLMIATPLSWWLTFRQRRTRSLITAVAMLPLVLPPSVLGFYLLLLLGSEGPLGALTAALHMQTLAFTFPGLVIASVVYSFPFALQPILNAFDGIGRAPLEAAATLRASPSDRFFFIALPLARPGIITAAILCFAHTIGEFGVILMIGGNIPGETRVLSIAIYDHVESLRYAQAHLLSGGMVIFSLLVLFLLYYLSGSQKNLRWFAPGSGGNK